MNNQVEKFRSIREDLATLQKQTESEISSNQFQAAYAVVQKTNALYERLSEIANPDSTIQQKALQNIAIDIRINEVAIDSGLEKREGRKKEDGNVAFKYNWNDAGYKGICSNEVYQVNRKSLRTECARSNCRTFVGKPPPIDECCYECQALRIYKFGAGWDHDKITNLQVRPNHINSVREGQIAILTSIPPEQKERLMIGAFRIIEVKDDPNSETFLFGDSSTALDDMLKYKIKFWEHHKNRRVSTSQAWGQGLFRYLLNSEVAGILKEYRDKSIADNSETSRVDALINSITIP